MNDQATFEQLGLNEQLLRALKDVGYESPSPIQAQSIPPLLEGKDILGQAQTGTGKTAAFALPILQHIDLNARHPQVLVLAPTRELAIQVAEAFQSYARYLKGFHILPIYGGQGYDGQIRALKRGVHVVVGTPGRVMDHMRKRTLKLDQLTHLVLDEADEMLRMGFIDDVEWVMGHVPEQRQIALFSATMPKEIAKVANTYLQDPINVKISEKTATAKTIHQRYWRVSGVNKLDALTRILELETFDGIIIFVRTKTATVELAEKLEARGFSSAALNGDISQQLRERTVDKLKRGHIDILVATDVVARGLDVERISHVINYDIPYDTEAYVHRIGRTGRAGRSGEAILFVAPREQRMLKAIERATGNTIEAMDLPSTSEINEQRVQRFKQSVLDTCTNEDIGYFRNLIESILAESEHSATDIAAALAHMSNGTQPFLLKESKHKPRSDDRGDRFDKPRRDRDDRPDRPRKERKPRDKDGADNVPSDTYRLKVGKVDGVTPGNIVGAIANEGEISSKHIGHIKLYDDYSTVDLPKGMPQETFDRLYKTWVCNKKLQLSLVTGSDRNDSDRKPKKSKPKSGKKKSSAKLKFD